MVSRATDRAKPDAADEVLVPIPAGLAASIDAIVGADGRVAFVRSALEGRVQRPRRFNEAIERLQGATIPEWDTPESTAAWLREIRQWDDHWDDDKPEG